MEIVNDKYNTEQLIKRIEELEKIMNEPDTEIGVLNRVHKALTRHRASQAGKDE